MNADHVEIVERANEAIDTWRQFHPNDRLDLSEADLSGADLRGANLSEADLSGADLSEVDLRGANLRGADLHEANMSGANLHEAKLSEANLNGANMRGANLNGATGLMVVGPGGSRGDFVYAVNHGEKTMCRVGCQWFDLDEFAQAVRARYGDKSHGPYYMAVIDFLKACRK